MSSSSCIVIIPAKNEVLHLQKVLEGVWEFFSPEEIVVIDDHSSDGTPELALQCGATVLSHPISLGYAATLQTGYKYALSKGYPYLIQLDGDGQHLPLSIPTLYTALQGNQADLVLGNRFLSPDFPYHPSFARRVGMRFFASLLRLCTQLSLSDSTSGFQGMTYAVYSWYAQDYFPRDFPDADILLRTHFQGFRIKEVPVHMQIPDGNISMHRGFLRPLYYVCKMTLSFLQTYFLYGGRVRRGN